LKIFNTSKNTVIAHKVELADTFVSRMVGLLNRTTLSPGEALVITHCQSIHTLFMRFAIDAIFVDKNNHAVGLCQRLKPLRLSPIYFQSSYVIELAEGTIAKTKTAVGDQLEFIG
jgi:uncharacterized membrane protein (UPF0127 family)